MKGTKKSVQLGDKSIHYTHFEMGSKRICFMFAGMGYHYDKSLFYYATMAMLQEGIDVVQIHYSYDKELMNNSLEEIAKIMMDDVNPVILEVMDANPYTETIFLGKSLGTIPIVNDLLLREEFLKSKMILLTPLLKLDPTFECILNCKHEGLLVIGDKDPQYHSDQVEKLKGTNLKIDVVKDADHALDVVGFETVKSIQALLEIMKKVIETVTTL